MTGLRLHLGVHKTGTSYLQRWLNRSTFAPETRWVNEVEARKIIHADAPLPDWLTPDRSVVLSDENLMGWALGEAYLYAHITPRLQQLAPLRPQIFLCLRNYADFLASYWVERCKHKDYRPFPTDINLKDAGWPHVLTLVQTAFPDSPITVWNYDHFDANEAAVAHLICGPALQSLGKRPTHHVNPRLSVAAIEAIKTRTEKPGTLMYNLKYPVSDTNPRYDPWTPETRAPLDAQFAEDWEKVAKIATVWQPS